jgi:predicted phosphoribosyltransferase
MRTQPYADRIEAGRELAGLLDSFAGRDDVTVLGLPRGGVPVAAQVARSLPGLLDVLVVRKLGLPTHRELAMGAIAGVGERVEVVRNDRVLRAARISEAQFDEVLRHERAELQRRETAYRPTDERAPVTDRIVIVVDDGVATGSTMLAALAAVRAREPARLVVAIPVAASDSVRAVRRVADDVFCGWQPEPFFAVGQGYLDFAEVTDDQVRRAFSAHDGGTRS